MVDNSPRKAGRPRSGDEPLTSGITVKVSATAKALIPATGGGAWLDRAIKQARHDETVKLAAQTYPSGDPDGLAKHTAGMLAASAAHTALMVEYNRIAEKKG